MQGKAEIRVGVRLAGGTKDSLQAQLDALSRKLQLNINKVKIQNKQFQKSINDGMVKASKELEKSVTSSNQKMTSSNKQKISSIDAVIARYKMQKIGYTELQQAMDKMIKRGTFQKQSLKQQAKAYGVLNKAEADNNKIINEKIKTKRKLQDANQKLANQMGAANEQSQIKKKMKAEKEAAAQNKAINAEQVRQYNQRERALTRIDELKSRITGKQIQHGDKVFANKNVAKEFEKLQAMMDSFGKKGGASIKEINKQYGNMNNEIKRVTKATKDANFTFSNMLTTGIKKMLIWSNMAIIKFILNNKYNYAPYIE